jgi:hypothetical protein
MARFRLGAGTPSGVPPRQRNGSGGSDRRRDRSTCASGPRAPRTASLCPALMLGLTLLHGFAPVRAQAQLPPLAEGFARTEVHRETGYAFGFAGFAPGASPGAIWFAVGHAVYHRDAQGLVTLVHAFPVQDRCEILLHDDVHGTLLFADDRSGQLQVLDLQTGIQTTRGLPLRTFDLVVMPSGAILASANPLWPASGAIPGLWLVDPTGGSHHRDIVQLGPGASGPLAVHPVDGDLYYATASASYPTPPGSVRVMRFGAGAVAAAMAGGTALGPADATMLPARLDGAFDIVFDDRGRLLASNPQDGRVEIVRADGTLDPVPLCSAQPGTSSLGMAFADGSAATLAAYQPGEGGTLWVATNDWSTLAAVHAIRAARPVASSASGPTATAGNLRVDVDGLPPMVTGVLAFNILPALGAEIPLNLGRADEPCWWGLDPQMPLLTVTCTADALGRAQATLPYQGGLSWTLALQVAAPTPSLSLCSSAPLAITLLP